MRSARPKTTEAEYLAWDLSREGRHEFVNGEIVAMAGAEPSHDRVTTNLLASLSGRLRGGPCRVHSADLRVRIDETGLYAYPDLTVVCGAPELAATRPATLLNPTVLVEVLSPRSTRDLDLGAKAAHYRRRASLRAYVLVSVADRRVEVYERQPDDRWLLAATEGEVGAIRIDALGVEVPLAEVFEGVAELEILEAALDRE